MKDIINIGTVNFSPKWGDKAANLKRILEYADIAGKQGVQLLAFPETSLSGYDVEAQDEREERMHRKLAETVPGESSNAVAEAAKKYGMYILFGLPERDKEDPSKVYNAVAVVGPDGIIGTARKIHLPYNENLWADHGSDPFLFDTPWGPIGVGICYDFYCFPEITRCARAMGARLFVNCTAISSAESGGPGGYFGNLSIKYAVANNAMFVATANLCGPDVEGSWFMGGSSIAGPSQHGVEVHYYAGQEFLAPGAEESGLIVGTADLSDVDKVFLTWQWDGGVEKADWKPDNYIRWFQKAKETDFWGKN